MVIDYSANSVERFLHKMSNDSLDGLYRDLNPHPPSCNCYECTRKRLIDAGIKSSDMGEQKLKLVLSHLRTRQTEAQKLEQDINLFLKYKNERLPWCKRLLAMLKFDFRFRGEE